MTDVIGSLLGKPGQLLSFMPGLYLVVSCPFLLKECTGKLCIFDLQANQDTTQKEKSAMYGFDFDSLDLHTNPET